MLIRGHVLSTRTTIVAAALLLGLAPVAAARESGPGVGPPRHVGTVTEPAISAQAAGITATNPTGLFASFDISWVDNEREVYYLADRSNNAVDVVDASDGAFLKYLGQGQFAGVITGPPTRSGPNGVVTDSEHHVWVGDGLIGGVGHSSLKEFDPNTGALLASIDNGGSARADELAFADVGGGRILIGNPNEPTNAFVTLVNTRTQSIIGKVVYDAPAGSGLPPAGHGYSTSFGTPVTQHGLEQPVFANGRFFLNVPGTIQNPGGEIDVFGPNKAEVTRVIPLRDCGGTGLAVGPQGDLIVECAKDVRVLDINNGRQEASVAELGGADEIWFNPGDNKVYFPLPANTELRGTAPAGIGIMDASSNHAFSLVAVPGAQGLHSIAVNANNNRVFLPNSDNPDNGAGGIAMLQAKAKPDRRADN